MLDVDFVFSQDLNFCDRLPTALVELILRINLQVTSTMLLFSDVTLC